MHELYPIQEFYKVLDYFAFSKISEVNENSGINLDKIRALIDEKCLKGIDCCTNTNKSFLDVSITPHGAVVFAEWSELIRKKSIKHKLWLIIEKIIWMGIGVGLSTLGTFLYMLLSHNK